MAVSVAVAAPVDVPARRRLAGALFAPMDIAVLVYFRVAFGVIVAWHGLNGLVDHYTISHFRDSNLLFNYWPFTFVKPLPSTLMYGVEILLVLAGAFLAVGLYYRASAIAIFVCVTYFFLLEQADYLNHMYLVGLIAFLMIFLPANRRLSLDARFDPSLRSDEVPAWTVWLLRFQIGVPYFFGGIAKLNADWFRGATLRTTLHAQRDFPLIGQFFHNDAVVHFVIFGSLALDLLVVFFLLNRHTRVPAYAAAITFHLINARFFHIEIFPWLMIGATAIFFPPDWPRRLLEDARTKPRPRRFWQFVVGFVVVGALAIYLPRTHTPIDPLFGGIGGGVLGYFIKVPWQPAGARRDTLPRPAVSAPRPRLVLWLVAAWVAIQVLVPLRHFLIPGNVDWTEQSQKFSWHMMLRNKTGTTIFLLRNPRTGKTVEIDPADYLTDSQLFWMNGNPDMTVQFAHYVRDRARRESHVPDAEVRVRTMISMNLRPAQEFIDPTVDLGRVKRPLLGRQDWIIPLAPRTAGPHQSPSSRQLREGSSSAG